MLCVNFRIIYIFTHFYYKIYIFSGVDCTDTDNGAVCGRCPRYYDGDGRSCIMRRNPCESRPCDNGLQCVQTDDKPFFKCMSCPPGFTSNDGFNCVDIDECSTLRPCDPNVVCRNLSPGFRCDPCPSGFSGHYSEGFYMEAIVDHTFQKQRCEDIDECRDRTARCGNLALCRNTVGSYDCFCPPGYIKSNSSNDCVTIPGTCGDGIFCDKNAYCRHIGHRRYVCKCKVGWAGNGEICGTDRDLDDWPDYDLGCSHPKCRRDNCAGIPNSGQEDADNDGIGDVCDLGKLEICILKYQSEQC